VVLNPNHAADFQCLGMDLPSADTTAFHITELTPYASPLGWQVLHHVHMFICDEGAPLGVKRGRQCGPLSGGSGGSGAGGACYSSLVFDRLAYWPVLLPVTAGIAVGRGTPFTRLLIATHYRMPANSTGAELAGNRFSVGLRIVLSHAPRDQRANTVMFHKIDLQVPPHSRGYEVLARLDAHLIYRMLGRSLLMADGELHLHLLHLHAHAKARHVSLTRVRNTTTTLLLSDAHYVGEGKSQRWHTLPEGTTLRSNDSLLCRCVFDNEGGNPLHGGMPTGNEDQMKDEEMCGAMLLYSPHDKYDFSPKVVGLSDATDPVFLS